MTHVWVIEIKIGKNWEPCISVGLSRAQMIETCARLKILSWKARNPSDKFRVRKYMRAE